ncbi:SsrA-binding protein SmpB [Candidatus Nucleicultrix amoebiphila]|jgi:SsrA-binding protein|uniref:SsrA-binding protein n=1 Tax=Candidatus Nucleicultrix amoebiphila FS5 TaxID=1414854 RepID=A0A1W6N375_9PROT|nr:SsrA-binding protein SmpB [Candidatus Nucleicultrix amoebiphila]ARN84263.1 SsrA-binding protein [Candidatus Nucleicultrix amoebiphila FS5]
MDNSSYKVISDNRRARHEYIIQETVEAGIILYGTEVKTLRQGQGSIKEAYAGEKNGELYLINSHIPEYSSGGYTNHEPKRLRKLLLKKREMNKLLGAIKRKGITLVPLQMYFNHRGIVKVLIGLAQGKRKTDKRQAEKEKDWKRDQGRMLRNKG